MGENEDTKYCSNCKRDIAVANFVMHEVHCARNIVLCKKCGEPVARSEMEEHEEEEHKLVPCELCNKQFEIGQMDDHKENCDKRLVQCDYCEMDCTSDALKEHMDFCGARTEQCEKCSRNIMYKDRARHESSNCEYPPRPEPAETVPPPNDSAFGDGPLFRDRGPVPFGAALAGRMGGEQRSFRSEELMRMLEPDAGFGRPRSRQFGAHARGATGSRAVPPPPRAGSRAPGSNPFSAETRGGLSRLGRNAATTATSSTSRIQQSSSTTSSSTRTAAKPRAPLHGRVQNATAAKITNATRVQNTHKSNLRPRGGVPSAGSNSTTTGGTRGNHRPTPTSTTTGGIRGNHRPAPPSTRQDRDDSGDEMDAVLAMQLHEELNSATDRINNLEMDGLYGGDGGGLNRGALSDVFGGIQDRVDGNRENRNPNLFEGDDYETDEGVRVPCEFCEQPINIDDLIRHQSGCDQAPARIFGYESMRPRPQHRAPDVNEFRPSVRDDESGPSNRGLGWRADEYAPTDFDQDDFGRAAARFDESQNAAFGAGSDAEMTMLPCEFCGDPFPADILVTHQPVCDLNRTKTPRPSSTVNRYSSASRGSARPPGFPTTSASRQNSAARVQRTLTNLVNNPTDPPLHLTHSSGSSSGSAANIASRSNATGPAYEPTFPAGYRSNKPRVVPPRVVNGVGLENASGRRTRINNEAPTRRPRPQEH